MVNATFFTYMLRCADGSIYVGHTDDLDVRLVQHKEGIFPGYTSTRRPVELIWAESFLSRDDAFAAERRLKKWSRAKKLALASGDIETLKALARRHAPDSRSGR